jgi:hypothetical protein
MYAAHDRYLTFRTHVSFNALFELKDANLHRIITAMNEHRRFVLRMAFAMLFALMLAPDRLAFAEHRAAYDEALPGAFPAAETAVAQHRAELMKIPGISMVYVATDGNIVVRVRKLTHDLNEQMPKELDGCPIRISSVEDVLQRHKHELAGIGGEDQIFSYGVETFPDGVLVIVVRLRRLDWENPIKVPTNIEGIPLRIIIAQDPLPN